eukprot:TRINITY_DN8752_c0_g1_i1.p1 TRINITY_DN8752_c0_g1~~TRINITY_DN8752_c0_g1_i1.p1  ORF type:complete len:244 (+),score=16.26 TRINITY_DN8752_c0_g1_i1:35-766(+)
MVRRETCRFEFPSRILFQSFLLGDRGNSNGRYNDSDSGSDKHDQHASCQSKGNDSADCNARNTDVVPSIIASISTTASTSFAFGPIIDPNARDEVCPPIGLAPEGGFQRDRGVPYTISDSGRLVSFHIIAKDMLGSTGAFRDAHVEFAEEGAAIHTLDRGGKMWTLDISEFPSPIVPDESRFSISITGEVLTVTVAKRTNLSDNSWREGCFVLKERQPTCNSSTEPHRQHLSPRTRSRLMKFL